MSETAAPQSTETTPAAPAPARRGRPPKAAAAPKPAAPAKAPDAPPAARAAANGSEGAKPAPAAPAVAPAAGGASAAPAKTPEVTVGGEKKAAEEKAAAEAAAKEAEANRGPRSKSLEEVRAERRARVAAEEAAKAAAPPAAGKDKPAVAPPPSPAEAATVAAAAAEEAGATKGDEEETEEEPAAPVVDPKKAAATAEVDIDAAKLGAFTKLNRDLMAATKRIRELESGTVPLADKFKAAQELAKKGDHFGAIKAAGLDLDAAVRQVMQAETEEKETDPKLKKLQDDLAAANEKLAALEGNVTKTDEETKRLAKARAEADRAAAEERIVAEVTLAADKFPFLSKSAKFVKEALDGADEAYPLAVKHLGRELTGEEKNNLLRAALEEAEEQHAARAKLYGVVPRKPKKPAEPAAPAAVAPAPPAAGTETPTTADAGMRGNVQVVKPRGKRTLAEIKAERRRAAGR